jgi:hypothetical protein
MSESIEKTFTVSSPARLSVGNIRGSVEIHPGDAGIIVVTAVKKDDTGDGKRTEIEITQEADGTVKATTRFPEAGLNWLFGSQPCEVDYFVKAPRQCSLKLNGVSNNVLAEGFEGTIAVNSISGEITLRDMSGEIRLHSVSGDVEGERFNGSLDMDTVSGDVSLKESILRSINSNTVSGDMVISTSLAEGAYNFKSVSGDVRLNVPPETHCTGDLHTVSGELVSAFPITGFSRHHGSQTVNIQGGGVKVSLRSVSGDLSLDCDGDIPPAGETGRSATSEARRAVLESVERGELSVEEALGKLQV